MADFDNKLKLNGRIKCFIVSINRGFTIFYAADFFFGSLLIALCFIASDIACCFGFSLFCILVAKFLNLLYWKQRHGAIDLLGLEGWLVVAAFILLAGLVWAVSAFVGIAFDFVGRMRAQSMFSLVGLRAKRLLQISLH